MILRLPGKKLVMQSYRWARSRAWGGVVVLGYHRLSVDHEDPFDLAVPPDRFAEHLEVIASRARPISLRDAVSALAGDGRLPRRAVVVTFDDGYADTIRDALPLLERTGVPATVFVTTGSLGREYWWDELTRILLLPPVLPERLELEIRGSRRTWITAAPTRESISPVSRRKVLLSLAAEMRSLEAVELDFLLQQLREWVGQAPHGTPEYRGLTEGEVQRLAASPLIEIGAHTVSHPLLPQLSYTDQRREVAQSRSDLERITGRPVTSFSYPNGSYSQATLAAVKEAGIERACSSVPDLMTRRSDLLALPRLWIDGGSERDFARWLNHWLTG